MGVLLDFLPILAFFITLKFSDVFIATGVAIAATIGVAVYQKVKHGKVEPMVLVSCGLMVLFGGLTIALHDEVFVKWKPTILFVIFAIALAVSRLVGDRPIAQRLLGKSFEAERRVWNRVNDGFTLFFVALAGLNLVIAYTTSTDTWATFKLFGLLGANLAASIAAVMYLQKHGKHIAPAGLHDDKVGHKVDHEVGP
jgi:intracellular septation protein